GDPRAAPRRRRDSGAGHGAHRRGYRAARRERAWARNAARRRLREGVRGDHQRRRGAARHPGRRLMPVFGYRALTPTGRARVGAIGADTSRGAWRPLRPRGVYRPEGQVEAPAAGRGRIAAGELAAATRQLATLVAAGVPVAEALETVTEQSEQPALVR